MLEKLKENKKLISFLVVITLIMVLIFAMINRCSRKVFDINGVDNRRIEETENKLSIYVSKDLRNIISDLSEKDNNWSGFPLSKNFLSKYNNIEGIFPEYQDYAWTSWNTNLNLLEESVSIKDNKFDVDYSVEWFLDIEADAGRGNYFRLIKVNVTYLINDDGEIDDLIKGEPILIYDNGEFIREYDKKVTIDNFRQLIIDILFFDAEKNFAWPSVAPEPKNIRKEPCSKKLCDKVLNKDKNVDRVYIDFFPEYNCGGGAIYYPNGMTIEDAYNNKECFVSCRVFRDGAEPYYEWEDPEHNYLYKLNFELDNENKLDDIKLEYIREISNEELEANYHF